ncbi:MAG TPA: hypothetical protein VMR99_01175 [Candidatus Paceibacterota bacterium]|nr:hypothetical protein [Candidatus Paceibacterota bacterium]
MARKEVKAMVSESYEEPTTAEELKARISTLQRSLQNAFTIYESDERLKKDPQVWMNHIDNALEQAHHLIRLRRKDHPELKDLFVRLQASCTTAEKRRNGYGRSKKLPGFID